MERVTISINDGDYAKLQLLLKDRGKRDNGEEWTMEDLLQVWVTCEIYSEYKIYKLLNSNV